MSWIYKRKIDVLISENASALPAHLELGFAIKKVVEQTGIPTITHDHDFGWERGTRYKSPHEAINEYVESVFPMRLHNVHAVINSQAQITLKKRFNKAWGERRKAQGLKLACP